MGMQFSNVFTQADPGQYVAVKSRHATSITGRTFPVCSEDVALCPL